MFNSDEEEELYDEEYEKYVYRTIKQEGADYDPPLDDEEEELYEEDGPYDDGDSNWD